jgi:V/A-type H+-transporting ATPase subunit K
MKWQIGLLAVVALCMMASSAMAAAEAPAAGAAMSETAVSKAVGVALAAAIVGALAIVGAGYAVGRVGSAALGAMAERPELFVRALVFVALAEGLAVVGFALAIVILMS